MSLCQSSGLQGVALLLAVSLAGNQLEFLPPPCRPQLWLCILTLTPICFCFSERERGLGELVGRVLAMRDYLEVLCKGAD